MKIKKHAHVSEYMKHTTKNKTTPKGDTTQKRRQSRRREKLNKLAKAAGFASWSAYETTCIKKDGLA